MVLSDNDLKLNDLFLKIPSLQVHSLLEPPCTFLHIPNKNPPAFTQKAEFLIFFPFFLSSWEFTAANHRAGLFWQNKTPQNIPASSFLAAMCLFPDVCSSSSVEHLP